MSTERATRAFVIMCDRGIISTSNASLGCGTALQPGQSGPNGSTSPARQADSPPSGRRPAGGSTWVDRPSWRCRSRCLQCWLRLQPSLREKRHLSSRITTKNRRSEHAPSSACKAGPHPDHACRAMWALPGHPRVAWGARRFSSSRCVACFVGLMRHAFVGRCAASGGYAGIRRVLAGLKARKSRNINNRKLVIVTSFGVAGYAIATTHAGWSAGEGVAGSGCPDTRAAVRRVAHARSSVSDAMARIDAGQNHIQTKKARRDGQALNRKSGCGGRI